MSKSMDKPKRASEMLVPTIIMGLLAFIPDSGKSL